jgi:SAM-dependent methyltransferase
MSAEPPCPLCGGASPKAFVRAWREYRLYDCPDCGAGFCLPFRNPGPEYYEHNTDVYATKIEETTDPMSFEYDEALALLARELRPGARLLDVGCGAGGFLHRARAAGFSASGLDFNPARVAALRGRGFDVFAGSLPELARGASAGSFDAVALFQVLEHLDDPAAWLDAAKGLLKPGGLLLVAVPNRERAFDPFSGPGLEEIDNPPHHLTRWNARALTGLLSRRGFEVRECRSPGYPLPLVRLILRNTLRFGLATRALAVDQLRHAPAGPAAGPPRARDRAVRLLVAAKSAALDAAAGLGYPLFRAAAAARGRQGAVLLSVARNPG